jgi:hypothetical protein
MHNYNTVCDKASQKVILCKFLIVCIMHQGGGGGGDFDLEG